MRKNKLPIVFIIFLSLFYSPVSPVYGQQQQEMQIHFIDVGQGDSILIQTPSNKTILIDGGPPEAGEKVVSYLEKLKINKIDLLIATHPDIDHIGGLPKVMKSIKVEQILDSGKIHSTKTYVRYLNQIRNKAIPFSIAKQGDRIKLDPLLNIQILNAYEKSKNNNQSSIALKVTYKDVDFLLMSDVEQEQEKSLLKKYDLQAEIMKVAHHGSNTSTSFEFLQHVNPQIAILTYSRDNDYGHPVDRVIDNLNRINALIYSTAAFGDILIVSDGSEYVVFPEKNPIENLDEKAG